MADILAMINDTISEAASETRPKRGRPRVTEPWFDAFEEYGSGYMFNGESRRTVVKSYFAHKAHEVLRDDERFRYIAGPDTFRKEILAELGRLESPAMIREAAAHICEHRTKAKDAIVMIRRYRLGKSSPGDFRALAEEIGKAIDAYTFRHPDMTRAQVRTALYLVGLGYEPDEDDEEGSEDDGEDE